MSIFNYSLSTNKGAVVLFCLILPSPTASIFRSGIPYAARTFLSLYSQRQAETLLSGYKGNKKSEKWKVKSKEFATVMFFLSLTTL